jgi:hypothetical protein
MNSKTTNDSTHFSNPNGPNGWLNLQSPHGFKSILFNYGNAAQAWYSLVHNINEEEFLKGNYKTAETELSSDSKYVIILRILRDKIGTHPILKQYLLDTGDSEIIFNVSKFASMDQKWLGRYEPDSIGLNKLGVAWMQIRKELQDTQNE